MWRLPRCARLDPSIGGLRSAKRAPKEYEDASVHGRMLYRAHARTLWTPAATRDGAAPPALSPTTTPSAAPDRCRFRSQ